MPTQSTDLELRIRAALEGIEQLTGFRGEVGKLGEDAVAASGSARKLDGALDGLAQLQEQIQRFRDLRNQVNELASAHDAAREKQRQVTAEVTASLGPTQNQISEQRKANAEVGKIEAQLVKARDRQREYTQQVIAAAEPSATLLRKQDESTRKLEGLERALLVAKLRQTDANAAVAAGSEPSEKLSRKHEEATRTLEDLSAQVVHAKRQLDAEAKALEAAGVNTAQLDQATARISQTFSDVAAKARAFAEAQAKLSFVPHEQLEREAKALRGSYDTLRASGKLSAQELAQANLKLQEGLLDLERRTNGWKDSLVKARVEIGASIAAFAPIAYSIKQASDFETALAGVRKVVDGTDNQFHQLTGRIRELSRELPISAEGLAEIAAAGGQLGVPIERLDQFIRLAAQVSVAFNLTADEAGQAVAKLGNIFDLPLERVGELASAINVLGNTTAAKEGQILDFLTRVGGSAKQFGLTAESVAALGASLIAMGRTPEVAATAVNALLVRLQAANVLAPKAREALGGIGLSAQELARQIRENPQAALETFLTTLDQLDGQARTEAIAQILGVEQADKIASLVGNINQYREALKNATDQQQIAGALQKEFDAQNDTARQQYQLLKNVLNDIVLTLGSAFLPAVKGAIAAGKGIAEAIAFVVEQAPGLTAIAVATTSFGIALSGLKLTAAATRVALTGMIGSLSGTAVSLSAYVKGTDAATASTSRLNNALGALFKVAGAYIAGKAIGDYLYDQFEIVRRAGLLLSQALIRGAEQVQYFWEVSKAVVTDDTIDAANKRHQERLAEINRILKEQTADAEKAGYNLKAGAESATPAQEALKAAVKGTAQTTVELGNAAEQSASAVGSIGDASVIDKLAHAQDALRAAQQVVAGLEGQMDSLSDDAFIKFEKANRDVLASAQGRVAKLKEEVAKLSVEGYQKLGVDASEVLTGIDSKATELLQTFKLLLSNPEADPRLLTAAFQELLKTLDSPQELEALRLSLAKVQISGFDTAKAIGAIDDRLKDVKASGDEATTALKEAFKAFGIQTRAELTAAAKKADEQFRLIRSSGQATAAGLDKAFEQYADAQLRAAVAAGEAAAKSVAGMLRAQASTDEQRAAVDRLIARYVEKGKVAARAGEASARGSEKATRALSDELSAIDAVADAYSKRTAGRSGQSNSYNKQYSAEAYQGSGKAGGTASAAAIDDRYYDLTAEQRAEVDARFQRLYGNYLEALRRRDGRLTTSGPSRPVEEIRLLDDTRRLISRLLSGREQPAAGRTVDININLGGRRVTVSGTPGAAQQLEDLLEELARQAGVSLGG